MIKVFSIIYTDIGCLICLVDSGWKCDGRLTIRLESCSGVEGGGPDWVLLLLKGSLLREGGRQRHGGKRLPARQRRPGVLLGQALGPLVVLIVLGGAALQAQRYGRPVVKRQGSRAPVLGQQARARVVQRQTELVVGARGGTVLVALQPVPLGGVPGPALLEAVRALHLARSVQHQLDAVRPLVVDAAPAHGLREVVQHGPRHARQVAQIAVLPLGLLHYRHGGYRLLSLS